MLIFTVLKPEQIDLNRTGAEGLVGLKSFLEFTAKGINALPNVNDRKTASKGVIEFVAGEIRKIGYTVHTNIGCSGYQVDVGIIHPENPEVYVLGLLFDSVNYYNGGTALDRNSTQESVLRGLGWKISRVWVLDWLDNSQKELNRIKTDIENAVKDNDINKQPVIETETTVLAKEVIFEKVDHVIPSKPTNYYKLTQLPPVVQYLGNSDFFASYESTGIIRRQIEDILLIESPISREVLCKRVLEAWGITRLGSRINKRFDSIFNAMRLTTTKAEGSTYFWEPGIDPDVYDDFRIPTSDDKTRRNLEHIPPREIAAAVKFVLNQQIGLSKDDLMREVARIFAFAKCTEAMQKRIQVGIKIATKRNWAAIYGERVISGV
jgi:hypothetical protein